VSTTDGDTASPCPQDDHIPAVSARPANPGNPDANYECSDETVPMLCPSCCTLDDIPDPPEQDPGPLGLIVVCERCRFTFPRLPGHAKELTLTAMRNHRCIGPEGGDWANAGDAILARISELGNYTDLMARLRAISE
jgi:hypothetical protein